VVGGKGWWVSKLAEAENQFTAGYSRSCIQCLFGMGGAVDCGTMAFITLLVVVHVCAREEPHHSDPSAPERSFNWHANSQAAIVGSA